MSACAITRGQCAASPWLARVDDSFRAPRVSRRSRRPHFRRCGRNRESRRRDSAAPASASHGMSATARSISATRARCPTSYCGIESGHRLTSPNPGAALDAEQRAKLVAHRGDHLGVARAASCRVCIAPPTNARARIASGRRAALELEAGEAARDDSPALDCTGTTKPNASRRPVGKSLSRKVRLTVAADA